MKSLTSGVLATALVVACCGCSGSSNPPAQIPTTVPPKPTGASASGGVDNKPAAPTAEKANN